MYFVNKEMNKPAICDNTCVFSPISSENVIIIAIVSAVTVDRR